MTTDPEQLRSYFSRWQNLEQQKADIAEDLKELFAEAKGNGYEPKVMRAAFRIKAKQENETDGDRELAAKIETYLEALEPSRAIRARTREKIEEFVPNSPETASTGAVTGWVDPPSTQTGSSDLRDANLPLTSGRTSVTVDGDESGTVVPSFLMKPPKPIRPYCQRPGADDCGGYGSRHCHQCELAHEREEAA